MGNELSIMWEHHQVTTINRRYITSVTNVTYLAWLMIQATATAKLNDEPFRNRGTILTFNAFWLDISTASTTPKKIVGWPAAGLGSKSASVNIACKNAGIADAYTFRLACPWVPHLMSTFYSFTTSGPRRRRLANFFTSILRQQNPINTSSILYGVPGTWYVQSANWYRNLSNYRSLLVCTWCDFICYCSVQVRSRRLRLLPWENHIS